MRALTPDETILGLLAIQPRHGYELLECFRSADQLGRVWNLSASQIYAVLKRLERRGWIAGHEVIPDNAPPRVEYTLTAAGAQRLYAWLNESHPGASIRRIRVEFLSRLYIARQLGLRADALIRSQRDACAARVAQLVAERDGARADIDRLALDWQIHQLEAALHWLARCEAVAASDVLDPTLSRD
ncbi:MAG: PadR family transcriptional regulator [Anaerolinea sp.]|nr:PadR family transcriptional regulator [Anaerolinea sp.]